MKQLTQYIQEKLHISQYKDLTEQEKEIKKLVDKWIKDIGETDFEWHLELIDAVLEDNTFEMPEKHIFGDLLKYENDKKAMNFIIKLFKEYKQQVEKQSEYFKKLLNKK